MKIEKVIFKNLNSLKGQHTIDFVNSELGTESIFAITGKTGAGKSTILDAISLALYGKTPRLDHINQSENEIITRHTDECFSHVTFSTSKGEYLAQWSQKATRANSKKPYRSAKHIISKLNSNGEYELISEKLKETLKKIEEITGMDFSRFSRSVLLAQGQFASFLNAKKEEKALLLEQITGVGIYTDISKFVFERHKEEKQKSALIKSEIEGLNILTVDELAELQMRQKSLQDQNSNLKSQLILLDNKIHIYDNIKNLNNQKDELEILLRENEEDIIKQLPQFTRLARALKAGQVNPVFIQLNEFKNQTISNTKKVADFQEQELKLSQEIKNISKEIVDIKEAIEKLEDSYKNETKTAGEVKLLDKTIKDTEKREKSLIDEITSLESMMADKNKQLEQTISKLEEQQKNQNQIKYFLEQNGYLKKSGEALGKLTEKATRILENIEKVKINKKNRSEIEVEIEKLSSKLKSLQEKEKSSGSRLTKIMDSDKALTDEFNFLDSKIKKGKYEENIKVNSLQIDYLHQLEENLQLHRELCKQNITEIKTIELLSQEISTNETALNENTKRLNREKETLGILRENRLFRKRIDDFAELRKELHQGAPCPLCGSTNHPGVSDLAPEKSETDKKIDICNKKIESLESTIFNLRDLLASKNTTLAHSNQKVMEVSEETALKKSKIAELVHILKLPDNFTDLTEITAKIEDLTEKTDSMQADVILRNDKLKSIQESNHKLNEIQKIYEALKTDILNLENQINIKTSDHNVITNEINELTKENEIISDDINIIFQKHKMDKVSVENLEQTIISLREKYNEYNAKIILKNENETKIAGLREEKARIETKISTFHDQIGAKQSEYKLLTNIIGEQKSKRLELYGDKDPDTVLLKLTEKISVSNKLKDNKVENVEKTRIELAKTTENIEILNIEIKKLAIAIEKTENLFSKLLIDYNFQSIDDFTGALLPEEEITNLQQIKTDLEEKKKSLEIKLEDRNNDLIKEKSKINIGKDPAYHILKEQKVDLEEQIAELNRNIGQNQQILTDNDTVTDKMTKLSNDLKVQDLETTRWSQMNMLIGSADGKKFREFAQGLTFELVVAYSNEELKKLTDHYQMRRDLSDPLELKIIDLYNEDIIRSTSNLSGGESFLVSLALALGLSRMNSGNIRVDSLFLDEGFGTLDDELLRSALDTLASLNQQGKQVGIISHVEALKEIIPVKIHVYNISPGVSTFKITREIV